jgi:uncharacterized protein (TIGR03437 family)
MYLAFLFLFLLFAAPSYSQSPLLCNVSTTTLLVRTEGLAERMGDIRLSCNGGTPGLTVTGNLGISLSVPITNHLTPGTPGDIQVTIDTGSGPVQASFNAQLTGPTTVSLAGLSFTTPPAGPVNIRVNNLRGSIGTMSTGQVVTATLAINGLSTIGLINNPVVVAIAQRGLLTNSSSTVIRCVGSPLPATIGLSNLFAAGTHFESTRLTEGFATAFQPRGPLETAGARFLIQYLKVPTGVLLYVPDVIAGSDALQPTAGGDLGQPQSGGQYGPGSGTLLLARVQGADAMGNGGSPVFIPPMSGAALSFDKATQLTVTNGSASVVYEVMDANPVVQESAQFPTFVSIASTGAAAGTAQESVSFAPVSTDATANTAAPIPRFIATQPPSDCQTVGDCNAGYFPVLVVFAAPEAFTAYQGGLALQPPGYIAVQNQNGAQSILNWTASVTYQSGSDWIMLDVSSGLNGGAVRVFLKPQKLAPGNYTAIVTIDAGVAGLKNIPVSLTVMALPPAPPPTANNPGVTSVTNGANFVLGPVVSGSIATIRGTKFSGKNVAVTFDGAPATILMSNDTQINVVVPDGMSGKSSAQVVVTVDGSSSPATTVPLATAAPAIFAGNTMNQDYSLNNATNGAQLGSTLRVFVTGLAQTGGTVLVRIGDWQDLAPGSAGPLTGWPGVQEVDVTVPADLQATTMDMQVCAVDAAGNKVCSAPAQVTLADAQQ